MQIATPSEQIVRRDIVTGILMIGITAIDKHFIQKGINLMIDITFKIKMVMLGHQK